MTPAGRRAKTVPPLGPGRLQNFPGLALRNSECRRL